MIAEERLNDLMLSDLIHTKVWDERDIRDARISLQELLQLRKQKKLLIADGERLANLLHKEVYDETFDIIWDDKHNSALDQHKELMESLEEEV